MSIPRPRRQRLSAEESRRRILDAAERHLARAGPEGLRLAELAMELAISHPAILHHFGSREGLVAAVVERAITTLNEELLGAFMSADDPSPQAVIERVYDTLSERGAGRLLMWLLMSGAPPPTLLQEPSLLRLAEALHARRSALLGARCPPFEDTQFSVELVTLAMLAQAVLGPHVHTAAGHGGDAAAPRRFHQWLAVLLSEHLSRGLG